ncbi:MAG: DMT family transporter [Oscillospiraceae bacterium]|nr:DMT family transporter [Oscillospiraceae bacterium]
MKKQPSALLAHGFALFTAIAWGSSFIASKILLESYSPTQLMLIRFALAYGALWLCCPKKLKLSFKEEVFFVLLAISGCSLYFFFENSALTHTYASNVSIIVAAAPILTAIAAHFFTHDEKLTKGCILGFAVAIVGVAMVVFNGQVVLKLSPLGDLLSFGAAASWAVYSILLGKAMNKYENLLLTRRLMFWGFFTALPIALIEGKSFSFAPLLSWESIICVVFLSFICSAIGYIFWSAASKRLGIVIVCNYVYIIPFFTMLTGVIVLDEPLSLMGIVGAVLITLGMFIADRKKSAQS